MVRGGGRGRRPAAFDVSVADAGQANAADRDAVSSRTSTLNIPDRVLRDRHAIRLYVLNARTKAVSTPLQRTHEPSNAPDAM